MTLWILKHAVRITLGIVAVLLAVIILTGLLYGLISLTDYSLTGTVVEVEEPWRVTVRLSPLSPFFWFDRLLHGGERPEEVVLIYNGDKHFEAGDRVYAFTFGVSRLTPEKNSTNALFILKFF